MRRVHLTLLALSAIGVGLAGCGKFQKPQRAAWRDQAEAACMAARQVQLSAYVSLRERAIDGPGTCGMEKPLKVAAFANGGIGLTSNATLACPVVATTDKWLAEVVQPAAMNVLGAQVIEMRAGSYSCRAMNNGTGTSRTSEHAYGNAVDVFSFRLNDGRNVTVKDGWRGAPEEQAFLREIFVGACEHFSTVLGPGADAFHYDHFHIDLARHSKGRRICKPVIKYEPNYNLPPPDPARPDRMALAPVAPQPRYQGPSDGLRPPGGVGNGTYAMASPGPGTPRYNTPQPYEPEPAPSEARGPLMLPGATPPTEELILGDDQGNGILDEMQPVESEAPITPRNDPFAYRPGQTGSLRR
jgi:hypothetical protein